MKPLAYLAVPYSHPDASVREARFRAANQAAAKLMVDGIHIFSPISHTHPIAVEHSLPIHWEFWAAYDRAYLSVCHTLYVLRIDGWQTSVGVTAEIKIAEEFGIPIQFIDP